MPGDGCSATCGVEVGYQCSGSPSQCASINACAAGGVSNCSANAACTTTGGGFICRCNQGYAGDGVTCTPLVI